MKQLLHIKNEKEGLEKSSRMMRPEKRHIFLLFSIFYLSFQVYSVAQLGLGLGRRQASTEDDNKIELSYISPKEYEIAEINVEGLETLDKNALISLSGLKVGDKIKIPGVEISDAIKKLWRNGIVGDVAIFINKVELDQAWLTISLKERPRLTRIKIENVNKTQQGEIEEKLNLIVGRVITDPIIKNAELTVKEYYTEKGFLNVDVKIKQEMDTITTSGVRLIIDVDKGPKVKIKNINFIGNTAYLDNRLRGKMKKTSEKLRVTIFKDAAYVLTHTSPKEAWQWLTHSKEADKEEIREFLSNKFNVNFFKTSKFVRDEYKADKDKVIAFYNSKGYRNARIEKDSLYRINDKEMGIDIYLEEGTKHYFRNITWVGNFVYTDEQLDQVLAISKGDVYDMELISKKLNYNPNGLDISSLYMDHGYLFFNINPVEIQIENDSIDVEMRIMEGEQATIKNIIIKGNDRTNDHVIRRELRTIPGDKFSRALLIRTQRELSQLGYFDPEQMGLNPIPNMQDGTVDIEYDLVEKPSDQVELSGGWGAFYGFVGTVGLVFNNFSVKNIPKLEYWKPLPVGDGQKLSLRVQANGKSYQQYSFTFTEPWLGGKKPTSLTFGINRSSQDNSLYAKYYGNAGYGGSMKLTSISVGIGKKLKWPDDYFSIVNTLSMTIYQLKNYSWYESSLGFATGTARNLALNTTIARSSIDAPMYPRNGSSFSLAMTLTPPYSMFNSVDYENGTKAERFEWVEYNKWMFDLQFYQSIFKNLVFVARGHLGFLNSYSKSTPIGPFDRFMLGGDGLAGMQSGALLGYDIIGLRGYENNRITPPLYTSNSQAQDDRIVGGTVYNKFVFEMRYPASLNPQATIYLLAFLEAGNNWYTKQDYNPFDLKRSAGIGARVFMPAFGLLGIDWGYGFDKIGGKVSGGQFHFSIGQQLR